MNPISRICRRDVIHFHDSRCFADPLECHLRGMANWTSTETWDMGPMSGVIGHPSDYLSERAMRELGSGETNWLWLAGDFQVCFFSKPPWKQEDDANWLWNKLTCLRFKGATDSLIIHVKMSKWRPSSGRFGHSKHPCWKPHKNNGTSSGICRLNGEPTGLPRWIRTHLFLCDLAHLGIWNYRFLPEVLKSIVFICLCAYLIYN